MPSFAKIAFFLSSAWFSAWSVGILGYAMSIEWARSGMDCTGDLSSNGSAIITLEPFQVVVDRFSCPLFGGSEEFDAVLTLIKVGAAPAALHTLVVLLLSLCLLFSTCSILLGLYNSVSNPYETYMGPMGVYVCSSLSAVLSVLVLILFAVNVMATNMAERLVEHVVDVVVNLDNKSSELLLGYYLVIPCTVLSLLSIVCIFMYEHAAYKRKREQQRPTEDAPKEIMMY